MGDMSTIEPRPDSVPQNYEEMHRDWGRYIQYLLNRTGTPTEDLLPHMWEKLLTKDVLRTYQERVQAQPLPQPDSASFARFLRQMVDNIYCNYVRASKRRTA